MYPNWDFCVKTTQRKYHVARHCASIQCKRFAVVGFPLCDYYDITMILLCYSKHFLILLTATEKIDTNYRKHHTYDTQPKGVVCAYSIHFVHIPTLAQGHERQNYCHSVIGKVHEDRDP